MGKRAAPGRARSGSRDRSIMVGRVRSKLLLYITPSVSCSRNIQAALSEEGKLRDSNFYGHGTRAGVCPEQTNEVSSLFTFSIMCGVAAF
jgi:hypothetical protein